MSAARPRKAFSKSPTANSTVTTNPGQMLNYLNNLARSVDSNFSQITNLSNETTVISPEATVRTSIAGDTVDVAKIRDFLIYVVNSLKANGGIN